MSALWAIFLGFIQGIAEFLPISSSGHLSVIQNIFQLQTAEDGHLLFDVLLHLGTLVSVCAFFWKDIRDMLFEVVTIIRDGIGAIAGRRVKAQHDGSGRREMAPARRMLLMILIGTLPLFVILPAKKYIEALYSNTLFIGIAFILTAAMLFVSDRIAAGKRTVKSMSGTNALVVGVCQAIAVIPGLSRSGTTITAGLATGLDRETAVRYSFLLSLPAILGANILELADAIGEGIELGLVPVYLLGMAVAAAVGYIAIGLTRVIVRKGKFGYFAYYCALAGVVTIVLTFFNPVG